MNVEVRPDGKRWLATSSQPKLRAHGPTPSAAVIALKRKALVALADDVDYVIEWSEVPRRDVAARDKRVLGKIVKWPRAPGPGRPFAKLDAATFGWLVDERFVLPSQLLAVGRTAADVRAYLEAHTGVTASGFVLGSSRPDCRVEVEVLVDKRGRPVKLPRAKRREQSAEVELSADITVKETKQGWRYRSAGGAVDGVAESLEAARDAAASAAWRALAERLSDEDLGRAGAMRLQFDVTMTTSEWVVDHLIAGDMHGGYELGSSFAALKKALGPPAFDPFDGEPLYGWGLRGPRGVCAWVGVRLRDAEDEVTERDAASYAKSVTEWELAATDGKAAQSVIAWLRSVGAS